MATQTIRRDVLRRRIQAGKVTAKCAFHYTDDYAYDAAVNFAKGEVYVPVIWDDFEAPALPEGADWRDHEADVRSARMAWRITKEAALPEGFIVFDSFHLNCESGGAYWGNEEKTEARLRVHSNLVYDLKVSA